MRRRLALTVIALPLVLLCLWWVLGPRPSNDRDWVTDQARLPVSTFDGDRVTIANVRAAEYRTTSDFDIEWVDRTLDLSELDSLWFVVEPFSEDAAAAHTFLSFGFADRDYVAISVEIRREKGESFSVLKGMLRQFELMYVVGEERDLVKLRTNHRKDPVYLYRMRAKPEDIRRLFVAMLERANHLAEEPAFYNTLTANCTNTLVRHVNALGGDVPAWSYRVMLPGYSDALVYDLGLIDTELPFEEARAHFRINDAAERWAEAPDFSQRIRTGL